jgi:gliding motility-associated-like protein
VGNLKATTQYQYNHMKHITSCLIQFKIRVMKTTAVTALFLLLFSLNATSQVFWTENFNNGCAANCDAAAYVGPNGPWTSFTGPGHLGFSPNIWYVSCAENGHTPAVCGSGCVAASATATLATLHVGSTTIGDIGAAFDAGGCFGGCTDSDIRSESPTINTTGKTTITLAFNYIANGDLGNDFGFIEYSTNSGATWTTLTTPAVTPICPSTQGRWQAFSIVLPASCDNIATLKIGFHWINNDDGIGTDPSFAVDDMTLSTSALNTITTGTIVGSPFCACTILNVPFTSTGTFIAGNIYTAQLSNAAGSFAAPVNIGTLVSTANVGTIACTIPCGTPTGSGYRIRVISSTPAITGSDNGVNIIINAPPVATFSYTGTPYCQNATNPSPTFSGGGVAGTFTSTAGLVFVSASTGVVNLAGSTAGTYTVANTVAASGGCAAVSATSTITITPVQSSAFNYSSSTFCQTGTNPIPTITGVAGGTFTSTAGLVFVSTSTGEINLTASTLGTYTITYTTAGPCGSSSTASVTITLAPIATFSYTGTPYCQNASNPSPTYSGGGTAGVFSSTAGLSINAASGLVNLSASTVGTYTVTNTIAASGGCPAASATSSITINAVQDSSFSYGGSTFCQSGTNPIPTTATAGGVFSSSAGLVFVSTSTGEINLAGSTLGTYTITYTTPGPCASSSSANITITTVPVATFSYTGTPYCQNAANPSPTFSGGGSAGTFTSSAGLVFVSAATGVVNLAASTPGTYTVTNTIAASGGCPAATATSTITITAVPTVTVNSATICSGQTATLTASGATTYTWSIGATSTGVNTATASPAGTTTYTVTGTTSGCSSTAVSVVTVNTCNVPVANFTANNTIFCTTPACVNFTDLSTNTPTSWSWSFPGASTTSSTAQNPTNICYNANGSYSVTLIATNANGSDTLTQTNYITVGAPVSVTISGNTVIDACEKTTLTASPGDGTYVWGPNNNLDCTTCVSVTADPPSTQDYYVTYTSPGGCTDSDTITVTVQNISTYFMPTGFSPNGDGINDVLYVHGRGIDFINLKIYDRVGEKVFESTSLDHGWDGKLHGLPMNDNEFVYKLEVTFCNGDVKKEHGAITLSK